MKKDFSTKFTVSHSSDTGLPGITSPTAIYADTGGTIDYRITSIANNSTFSVDNLPVGLTFDGVDRITGKVDTQGIYYIHLRATANGQAATEIVRLTVATPVGPSVEVTYRTWSYNGPAQWFGQTGVSWDGEDSGQAGAITHSQESSMSITVNGPDRVVFWWKVSSEEFFDILEFQIDGNRMASVSGEQGWLPVVFDIPSGSHTLTWRYSKDLNGRAGSDTAWVDNIRFASEGYPFVNTRNQTTAVLGQFIRIPIEFVNADSIGFSGLPGWLTYDAVNMELSGTPDSIGSFNITANAGNTLGNNSAPINIYVGITNNLLRTAIDQPQLITSNNADTVWFNTVSAGATDGIAARSGSIGNSASSTMSLHVQGPGTLSFRWMVSSQANSDFLTYRHNNGPPVAISGEIDWSTVTLDLTPGLNSIIWTYRKDGAVTSGEYLGRVDAVQLAGYARFLADNAINHFSSAPGNDTDNDSLSLFHEYAFLGSTTNFDSNDILRMIPGTTPNLFNLRFTGLTPPANVEYVLESSPTMLPGSWTPVNSDPQATPAGPNAIYTYPAMNTSAGVLFYRIRAIFK